MNNAANPPCKVFVLLRGTGEVHLLDAQDCVVWSSGTPIVVSGVKDLVIVHANGRILVLPRAQAADLKAILDRLPASVRDIP